MLCVISVDPVLSVETDLKVSQARRGSVLLYEALVSQYDLVALGRGDQDLIRWWLRKERMPKWASIKGWDDGNFFLYDEWKTHEIGNFLSASWEIGMYMSGADRSLMDVWALGVMTMEVRAPLTGPGFRDLSESPRAWADVAGTVLTGGDDDGPG